jgi:hypothetical protein
MLEVLVRVLVFEFWKVVRCFNLEKNTQRGMAKL